MKLGQERFVPKNQTEVYKHSILDPFLTTFVAAAKTHQKFDRVMNTSKKDIKWVRSLQQKKFRKELSLFVVEGKKLTEEAVASGWKVHSLYSTDSVWAARFNAFEVSEKEMQSISSLSTPSAHLAVMHTPSVSTIDPHCPLILVLDGISDPGNLGTLLRTADWFGIRNVLLSHSCVELFNPKVVQSTMGSIFRMKCVYDDLSSALPSLKSNGFGVFGTLLQGTNLFHTTWPLKTALVLGSESHGISEAVKLLIDQPITIPGYGAAESLNVAVAGAITMAEWRRVMPA